MHTAFTIVFSGMLHVTSCKPSSSVSMKSGYALRTLLDTCTVRLPHQINHFGTIFISIVYF